MAHQVNTGGMLRGGPREESPAGLKCPLEQPCRGSAGLPAFRTRHTQSSQPAPASLNTTESAWGAGGVDSTNFQGGCAVVLKIIPPAIQDLVTEMWLLCL